MLTREIDPAQLADIAKFEAQLGRYLAGEIDEDVFRVFRLNNGIYGQRQGGHNQMVRVKIPYGSRRRPSSSRCSAHIADDVLPRLGPPHHPPEHPVPLRRSSSRSPEVLRDCSPSVGLTTPRGVRRHRAQRHGLPPRRRLPLRGARHHAVGRGRLPTTSCATRSRSACPASSRSTSRAAPPTAARRCSTTSASSPSTAPLRRRHASSPASGCSSPAASAPTRTRRRRSRSSRPARTCCRRIEAILRVFDHYGNRDNKLRARMKWLVDTHGHRRAARAHPQGAQVPARVVHAGRAASPTTSRSTATRPPASARRSTPTADRPGHAGRASAAPTPYERWDDANVVRGAAKGTVSAVRLRPPRRHHLRPVPRASPRSSASFGARGPRHQPPEPRVPRPHRGAAARLFDRLDAIGMAEPGAELARDVVACPGADTCNLAVTQSPRPRRRHRRRARGGRPGRGRRRAHQHLGLHQLAAASTTSPTSASSASSAAPTASAAPGYQMLLGGYVGEMRDRVRREGAASCRPRRRPRPPCGSSAASPTSARPARRSATGSTAPAAPRRVGADAQGPRRLPDARRGPDFYVDFDETGPYVAEIGDSECAT